MIRAKLEQNNRRRGYPTLVCMSLYQDVLCLNDRLGVKEITHWIILNLNLIILSSKDNNLTDLKELQVSILKVL